MDTRLLFSGVRLYVNTASGQHSIPAVSGKPRPDAGVLTFSYSQKAQANKDVGPLPAGNYTINTADIIDYRHTKGAYVKAALAPILGVASPSEYLNKLEKAWGKMPGASGKIVPIKARSGSTDYAFGRNRCWIHGSDFPGSIGCIDLTSFMDAFIACLPRAPTIIPLRVIYGMSPTGREPSEIDPKGREISNIA